MATPVTATIFAYQVGFGDCFLLRFDYDDATRRHVLIDFGTTGLPENAAATHMLRVAQDIQAKCAEQGGNGLDLLVATHRHADHISGFATKDDGSGSGDVIRALNPTVILQPWTEAPDAAIDSLGPDESARKGMAMRQASLQAMHAMAENAVAYVDRQGSRLPKAVAAELRFIGEDNIANLSAIRNLQSMPGRHEYVYHGCELDLSQELPGVAVDVLGPPTLLQTDTIRKQRSRDKDEFWQLGPKRFADAAAVDTGKKLFPGVPVKRASKLFTEQRWLARRIDDVSSEMMLSLVRKLDGQMNNTSVILLIRAGTKTLLFPGDAQLENWQYALQSDLAPLLDDVDVYKVGHHGSLNATPRSMWKRFKKKGPASQKNRLTSVLSTKHGKHGSDDKDTEVPRRTLVAELDASSDLHSTERLEEGVPFEKIVIPLV